MNTAKTSLTNYLIGACTFLLVLNLSACAPKTPSAKFYLLQPTILETSGKQVGISYPLTIGVGPVDIPAYLDRPQIIVAGQGAQVEMDEFNRWAEPLRDNITRVLTENLSHLQPDQHFLAFPWNRGLNLGYQVEVQILRFHVNAAGMVELIANWSISKQGKALVLREFHSSKPVSGEGFEARAASQSAALGELSKALADGLVEVSTLP